jgi:predicted nucleic acid-binding protein
VNTSASSTIAFCYLDTSLLVAATTTEDVNHKVAREYCSQLATDGATIYVSQFTRLEYAHFLRTLVGRLDPEIARRDGLHRWEQNAAVRSRWIVNGLTALDDLMSQFAVQREIPVTGPIVEHALRIMSTANLSSYDSVHVASAISSNASVLAATDNHFLRAGRLIDVRIVRQG